MTAPELEGAVLVSREVLQALVNDATNDGWVYVCRKCSSRPDAHKPTCSIYLAQQTLAQPDHLAQQQAEAEALWAEAAVLQEEADTWMRELRQYHPISAALNTASYLLDQTAKAIDRAQSMRLGLPALRAELAKQRAALAPAPAAAPASGEQGEGL